MMIRFLHGVGLVSERFNHLPDN